MKDIIWKKIIIGFFIPLILLLIFCFIRLYQTPKLVENCKLKDICDKLETGDLLFVRYNSKWGKIISIGTLVDLSHSAFVYKQNKDVFIIEMSDYTNYDEPDVEKLKGLCIIKLDKWISLNKGRICIWKKYFGDKKINENKINKIIKKYKNINLDMDLLNWSSVFFKNKNKKEIKTDYFCSEFIALLLQKLKILNDYYDPSFYSPAKLTNIKNYSEMKIFNID